MTSSIVAHAVPKTATCLHCGNPAEGSTDGFCCTGCKIVYGLLQSEHLDRYYDLRGAKSAPAVAVDPSRRDYKWIEALDQKRKAMGDGIGRVELDLQGMHCSACVWLIEALFRRHDGGASITINPSLGRAQLYVQPSFDVRSFVEDVERFGYLFGPALKEAPKRSNELAIRMGVCIAIAMNAMIFGIASYAGLTEGPTSVLFQRWTIALSLVSLVVGGSLFFKSAWEGVKRGVPNLDLPIALGIALAFAGSLVSIATHRAGGVFIDTIDVFIALMLVGRFLQERVLEKNRLALLANDGVEGLLARREKSGAVATVKCTELTKGDVLVVAPGDLVPVDAKLGDTTASFSLDWINGESRPRRFVEGSTVPAGAFLTGDAAVRVVAQDDFANSPLVDLLRTPATRPSDLAMSTPWWQMITRAYVAIVLFAAAVGFVGWMVLTHDVARSLQVATAVLVVTCPCAFGIATPLGYELVQAGLRRSGLFVRNAGFLDRAEQVRQIVFDKTGTLTMGVPSVEDLRPLRSLPGSERRVLAAMVSASHHPKSVAVERALRALGQPIVAAAGVREIPGRGLVLARNGVEYRVGAPAWVSGNSVCVGDVAFGANGELLADIATTESLRSDAAREISALERDGYEVWMLSGDDSDRTAHTAALVGIEGDHAFGGKSAEGKAAWLAEHERGDVLMIGDGINDSLVVEKAFCSGTPAVDRPFMAARSDFYFVTPGLRVVRLALDAAKKLGSVRRRNLALALFYNTVAITLAYAGLMSPVVCAVFMPATSITTILTTTMSLNSRSSLWRS